MTYGADVVSAIERAFVAQLHPKAYDFKRTPDLDFLGRMKEEEQELKRLEDEASKLGEDEFKGALVRFPVADGYAIYLVTSETPLKLQHVPFFDAYRVDPATIRGLRLEDVRRRVIGGRMMRSMFAAGVGATGVGA
jgi:hypothetical protein